MERNQIPYYLKTVASSVPTVLFLDNGDIIINRGYFGFGGNFGHL